MGDYKAQFEMKQNDWVEACKEIDHLKTEIELLKIVLEAAWIQSDKYKEAVRLSTLTLKASKEFTERQTEKIQAIEADLERVTEEKRQLQIAVNKATDEIIPERDALKAEVETLRRYGNKDCTAMADEALKSLTDCGDGGANDPI